MVPKLSNLAALSATVAALAAAVAASGCGSSSHSKTAGAATSQSASSKPAGGPVDVRTLRGRYAATLTSAGLRAVGVDTINVGGPGVWHMSIGRRNLTFTPASGGGDATTYPIAAVTPRKITLGPESECSTEKGRSHRSTFRLSQTAAGLRFIAVSVACPEDGGALAVAPWHKQ